MNKILLFILVPCVLAFVFVQCQYYGSNPSYGSYGQYGYGSPYYPANQYRRRRRSSLAELLALLGLLVYFAVATNLTGRRVG